MNRQCPKCESHDSRVCGDECICNVCDTTIDVTIDGVWMSETKSFDLMAEAQTYNQLYHRFHSRAGHRKIKGANNA